MCCSFQGQKGHGAAKIFRGAANIDELGMILNFQAKCFVWDNIKIDMHNRGGYHHKTAAKTTFHAAFASFLVQEAEVRQRRILDEDYRALHTDKHVFIVHSHGFDV